MEDETPPIQIELVYLKNKLIGVVEPQVVSNQLAILFWVNIIE